MSETWVEMSSRHKAERMALVKGWAARRVTQALAANRLGISRTLLNNYIQRHGIHWAVKAQGKPPQGHQGRKPMDLDIGAITEYYLDGFTLRDCGEKFGVHAHTISAHLKRAGVEVRPSVPALRAMNRDNRPHTPASHGMAR